MENAKKNVAVLALAAATIAWLALQRAVIAA
jgi:hypothetical protein